MKLSEDHRKLVKIASLYYQEGYTQAEIGKIMDISRPVISKLLNQAKEQGIISVYINDESSTAVLQGIQLQQKFGLKDVLVVPEAVDKSALQTKKRVARATANYLLARLPAVTSIGLSWGTTLADVIDELPYVSQPSSKTVPLVGGVSSEHLYYDTNHLVFCLAQKIKGSCRYFYAPALAESSELAHVLAISEMVKEALHAAREVDIALVGVGNPQKHSTWKALGYMDFAAESLQQSQNPICGDAVASLFDKNGKTIDNELTNRMIGIKVEDFDSMKEVVLIASGKDKAASLLPLLQTGANKTLVIDQAIAEILLEE